MAFKTDADYRIVNGTYYDPRTPDAVIQILENARRDGTTIHISLGHTDSTNPECGRDWLEEFETTGVIGRSCGPHQVPILLPSKRSRYGGSVLDHRVVRIRNARTGTILYQHPKYSHGAITVHRIAKPIVVGKNTLTVEVKRDGETQARFVDRAEAEKYCKKLGLSAAYYV